MQVNPAPVETAPSDIYIVSAAYNLFRRKQKPDVLCAVPEDRPVPAFINATGWDFAGKADEPATLPLGFNQKAARVSVGRNGYYLFEAFSAVQKRTAIWPVRCAA